MDNNVLMHSINKKSLKKIFKNTETVSIRASKEQQFISFLFNAGFCFLFSDKTVGHHYSRQGSELDEL